MTASPEVIAFQRIADVLGGVQATLDEIHKLLRGILLALPTATAMPVGQSSPCCSHPPGTTCTRAMPR